MKKMIMGVIGAAITLTGLIALPVEAAVTCPDGSIHAGQSKDSYASCNLSSNSANLWDTVNAIITTIIAVLGVVTVVVIIIGGVNYVLSQGDPGKLKKAKDTIMYGLIGLVIALLAFVIVNFVLNSIFGSSSTGTSGGGNNNTNVTNNSGSGSGSGSGSNTEN